MNFVVEKSPLVNEEKPNPASRPVRYHSLSSVKWQLPASGPSGHSPTSEIGAGLNRDLLQVSLQRIQSMPCCSVAIRP